MKNRKKELFYWSIIILLIIVIILLLLRRFGRVEDNILKPTGNVDVFDIDIDCVCKDKNMCPNNKDTNKNDTNNNDNINPVPDSPSIPIDADDIPDDVPVYDEDEDIDVTGTVFVDDKNGNYIYQQNLKIFTNSAFEQDTMIAPGVSNTYNFVVHNSSNINLLYNINIYDISEYKINMVFRLRRNNKYIVGSTNKWINVSDLNVNDLYIKSGDSDSYSLDWKWVYEGGKDKEDSIAGEKMTSKYKLNIKFNFLQARTQS